jgi:hypothetical protein
MERREAIDERQRKVPWPDQRAVVRVRQKPTWSPDGRSMAIDVEGTAWLTVC